MDEEISERTFAPVDLTYGQRSALPDLDDENEDGSVNEALEYLRSVRYVVFKIHHSCLSFIVRYFVVPCSYKILIHHVRDRY